MSRIEIVTIDKKKYIIDHQNEYHIAYYVNDIELEQPLGYYSASITNCNT